MAPLTNDAASEQSHKIAPEISDGLPYLFIGVFSRTFFPLSVGAPFSSTNKYLFCFVSKNPGATALTRILTE